MAVAETGVDAAGLPAAGLAGHAAVIRVRAVANAGLGSRARGWSDRTWWWLSAVPASDAQSPRVQCWRRSRPAGPDHVPAAPVSGGEMGPGGTCPLTARQDVLDAATFASLD